MKKLKSKIIAIAVASVMAVSMAVTASAETKYDTTTRSTPYGTMTGTLTGWCAGGIAETTVTTPAYMIISGVQGNSSYFPHRTCEQYNSTYSKATTGELGNIGEVSSFWGSHEVRTGQSGYGAYTAVTNCY